MSGNITPTRSAPMAFGAPNAPTGSWRHPLMDAITKRKSETSFTTSCFYRVSHNAAALVLSFFLVAFLSNSKTATSVVSGILSTRLLGYVNYAVWFLRLLFVYNILESLARLLRTSDECADMPLTPNQRALLGLNPGTPLSAAIKPTDFVTPPRYQKATPSSRSNSPMHHGNGTPNVSRRLAFGLPETEREAGSPQRSLGPAKMAWGSASQSPKTTASSLTPSNRWAYDKGIMQRKSEGVDVRISPSKTFFGPPR